MIGDSPFTIGEQFSVGVLSEVLRLFLILLFLGSILLLYPKALIVDRTFALIFNKIDIRVVGLFVAR